MTPTPQDPTLAERIVDRLLTMSLHRPEWRTIGTRLQIMQQQGDTERALGGWCRKSAIREVQEVLDGQV